ncbi:hypothetical protein [Streptodolium elevatio]|uniref:Uncharacterized protein n=1 Tax=Streptodolium elevatio TaxID=3157996 RepID=A0ABV3DS20_9ACTN
MSRYAFDPARHELQIAYATGSGDTSGPVAALPGTVDAATALALARELTRLAEAAWRTYTHPSSAADDHDADSEGRRRDEERRQFADVANAVTEPNLPDEAGGLDVLYSPLGEYAHRVGRILHRIGYQTLTDAVVTEVSAELQAVEHAELGELQGRARQAVVLSREDASPLQVAAADRLLHENPLGAHGLFTDLEPTAAAVAAAHWLVAAADVASEASGIAPVSIVVTASDTESLPHETPTQLLELVHAGVAPRQAVCGLVRGALRLADGQVPDYQGLIAQIAHTEQLIAEHGADDPVIAAALRNELRLTPLDPSRPAPDLLEDLLEGIRACWLIYSEHAEFDDDTDWADLASDVGTDEGQDADDADDLLAREFIEAVRSAATESQERLS